MPSGPGSYKGLPKGRSAGTGARINRKKRPKRASSGSSQKARFGKRPKRY